MISDEAEGERARFVSYEYYNTGIDKEIDALIDEGKLPFDSLFRLGSIGRGVVDTKDRSEFPKTLSWNLLTDMIQNADKPDTMRPDTRELLWGEPPNAVVDPASGNRDFYAQLDPMYYHIADLASAIKRRRKDEGETAGDVPPTSHQSLREFEWSRCVGLARPLWRVMVKRVHPEWLENPVDYYHPTISFNGVYYASDRTMRREVIGWTVLSDTVVFETYSEAITDGVKGIGSSGKNSLRELLTDEHPELL